MQNLTVFTIDVGEERWGGRFGCRHDRESPVG